LSVLVEQRKKFTRYTKDVKMKIRLFLFTVAIAVLLALGSSAFIQDSASAAGPVSQLHPFRPVHPDYLKIKAGIDARAPRQAGGLLASLAAPSTFVSKAGQGHTLYSPSDSNGAISPDRYIELVNVSVGVYDRNLNLLSQNSQATWTGISSASGDAAIMWSPNDNRFYASMLAIAGSNYQLIFGFSKGASPSASNSDWCFYQSNFNGRYGSNIPDYPKLGDSRDFILMGVNVFNNSGTLYLGSDVAWVSKPAAGTITTCPALTSLKMGTLRNIKNTDGTQASTPNPAKQTETIPQGVVVSNKDSGAGTSTVLTVHYVTKNALGNAVLSAPHKIIVPAYAYPPSAPQQGTTAVLDTLDARLMSAWVAQDPSLTGSPLALWTGHTVMSSSGRAEFRWYEITTAGLKRNGTVNDPSLYVFMGAIAPDRNGTSHSFGGNALMVFNTSSTSALPSVAMASVSSGIQTGIVNVFTSPAADTDFTCSAPYGPPCRWGDYSGASPDPASITTGKVWGTGMTSMAGSPGWASWNFGATP
jgi:hypothetical protein